MLIISPGVKTAPGQGENWAARKAKPQSLAENIREWSDAALYQKCKIYGFNARVWLRRFAGLLPEVNRRQLYKRRGYASLHEFARKLAGMSDYTVDKILNIAKKIEDKPALKEQFISGNEGWSKIEKVAYIATAETDEFWAKKVSALTQWALESYVQEFRKQAATDVKASSEDNRLEFTLKSDENNNLQTSKGVSPVGFSGNLFGGANIGGINSDDTNMQNFSRFSFPVTQELDRELKLLKQQLEKQRGQTLVWGEVIQELLRNYHSQKTTGNHMESKQKKIVAICPSCIKKETHNAAENGSVSRNIPSDVKKIIDERYHHWCAYPNCKRPPEIYHHTRRFSLNKNHDPDFIVPLCTAHERLAHSGLIANEEQNPASWKILAEPDKNSSQYPIDQIVNTFRKEKPEV